MKQMKWILPLALFSLIAMTSIAAVPDAWRYAGDMINNRQMHAAAYNSTDTTLYVIGGNSDPAFPQDNMGYSNDSLGTQYYKFDFSGAAPAITEFGWGPTLPSNWKLECVTGTFEIVAEYNADGAFVYNNRVYMTPSNTNGSNAWAVNEILVTDISTTGGLLGTWTVAGNPPVSAAAKAIQDAGWEAYNGRVYRASGREVNEACGGGSAVYVNRVDSAPINPDGTIGTWRSEAALPIVGSRYGMLAIVNNLAICIPGQVNGTTSSAVYVGQVDGSGAIASWAASANPFPSGIYMMSGGVSGDYVYVCTGRVTSTIELATSYRAKVNALGTDIEAWEAVAGVPFANTTSVNNNNRYAAAAGNGGKFFITGGRKIGLTVPYTNPMANEIFVLTGAPVVIGDNAALGTWDPGSALVMAAEKISNTAPKAFRTWKGTASIAASTAISYKILRDGQKGWGAGNEFGDKDNNNLGFTTTAASTSFWFDEANLGADGWAPAVLTNGNDVGTTWVAVGDLPGWNPESATTVMKDDGANGDAVAADGVFTYEFVAASTVSGSGWKAVRQGPWAGSTKFGTNGWSFDPGDSNNDTFDANAGDSVKLEFDQYKGRVRSTVTPGSPVQDWTLY